MGTFVSSKTHVPFLPAPDSGMGHFPSPRAASEVKKMEESTQAFVLFFEATSCGRREEGKDKRKIRLFINVDDQGPHTKESSALLGNNPLSLSPPLSCNRDM